jgi:hypothetical protein
MLIYEVNLELDEDINFKVAGWLTEHIDKMLAFKGFKVAQWFFRRPEDEGRPDTKKTLWTIQYLVEDRASLDAYLNEHAEKMRADAVNQFGDKLSANRRVLNLLSVAGLPFEGGAQVG